MPRNRELMRVFKDVGLVEQLGTGMNRILKVYEKSIFQFFYHIIKVNFPIGEISPNTSPIISPKLIKNYREQIIALIEKDETVTQKIISDQLRVTTRTIKTIMKEMTEEGKIKREGSSRKGIWIKL